jgi:ApbE superfamily uncharacterized protein (UPF0280 family)
MRRQSLDATMTGPVAARLPDGRLHLQHGPIDLIIEAWGADRDRACMQAVERFRTVLDELVAELPGLRRPLSGPPMFTGPTARRMAAAVASSTAFITPMAAVAGAVADEVLSAMTHGTTLDRAYVNNGGDIAFHLGAGQSLTAAIHDGADAGRVTLGHGDGAGGLATSGWRGRSHSLGIADAVTVVAANAAVADAAATLIANAVDLPDHPAVTRTPARDLSPDSDLGDRRVTTGVGPLIPQEFAAALDRGLTQARAMHARGLILGAALFLDRDTRLCGHLATHAPGASNARLQTA